MGWRVASPPTTRAGSCRAAYRHPLYRCCLRDNVPPRSSRVRDTSRCPRLDRATSLGHPSLWSPRPAAPRRSRARPLSARLATTRSARPSYRTQSARSDAYPPGSWASSPPLPVGAPRCSMAHCHPDGSRDDLVARRNAGGLATPPPPPLAPSLAPLRRRQGVWLRRPLGPLRGPRNRLPSHRPASPPCETRRAGLAPGCAWSGRGWRPRHRPATPGGYEHTGRVLLRSTPIGHRHLWGWPPRGGALRGRHPGRAFESARAAYSRLCHPGRRGRRPPSVASTGLTRNCCVGATTPPCPRRRNGGRWSRDCFSLMRIFLTARSRRTPSLVRRAMCSGWQRRWWALLACAVQRAVAMSATSAPWASTPPTPATPPCPLAILSLADFAGPSRLGFPA